jgi:hypothetical protein
MIFEPSRIIDVSVPSRSIETTTELPVESVSSSSCQVLIDRLADLRH